MKFIDYKVNYFYYDYIDEYDDEDEDFVYANTHFLHINEESLNSEKFKRLKKMYPDGVINLEDIEYYSILNTYENCFKNYKIKLI